MNRFLYRTLPLVFLLCITASACVYSLAHLMESSGVTTYLSVGIIILGSIFLLLPVHYVLQAKETSGSITKVLLWMSLIILVFAALLTLFILAQFSTTNPQGEAGMGFVLIPIAIGFFTGVLVCFLWVTAGLVAYFSFFKLVKMLGVFCVIALIAPYAVSLVVSRSFCLLTDGKCLGKLAVTQQTYSICDKSFDRYGCYTQYAIDSKDYSVCNILGGSSTACIREYAVQRKQPELCSKISEAFWRTNCCEMAFGYPSSDYSGITDDQAKICDITEYLRDQRKRYWN